MLFYSGSCSDDTNTRICYINKKETGLHYVTLYPDDDDGHDHDTAARLSVQDLVRDYRPWTRKGMTGEK